MTDRSPEAATPSKVHRSFSLKAKPRFAYPFDLILPRAVFVFLMRPGLMASMGPGLVAADPH